MVIKGWILFIDTPDPKKGWKSWIWRKFTCDMFRHVIIVQKLEYEGESYYTYLDPAMGWLCMRPLLEFKDENIFEFGYSFMCDVTHIVAFEAEEPTGDNIPTRGLYSCVGVIKQILGIKDYSVWTPKGLYNLLINKYKFKEILLCSEADQTIVR